VKPDRPRWWEPEYRTAGGTVYGVEGVSTSECPVSLVRPATRELVQILGRARRAREAAGPALLGPDLSRWPARLADAVAAIEEERIKVHNAEVEAEASET
jgi:hypothetical protein